MLKISIIVILATTFFYFKEAIYAFILLFVIVEGYLFLISLRKPKYAIADMVKSFNLNQQEEKVLKKYYLYFRYPHSSRSLSSTLSLIALLAFILVPVLIYNSLWLEACIIGINYFFAQKLSSQLNIRFYLHDYVERLGREEFREEMVLVESVCEKILKNKPVM